MSFGDKCAQDFLLMSQISRLPQKVAIRPGLKQTEASVLFHGFLFDFLLLFPNALFGGGVQAKDEAGCFLLVVPLGSVGEGFEFIFLNFNPREVMNILK